MICLGMMRSMVRCMFLHVLHAWRPLEIWGEGGSWRVCLDAAEGEKVPELKVG